MIRKIHMDEPTTPPQSPLSPAPLFDDVVIGDAEEEHIAASRAVDAGEVGGLSYGVTHPLTATASGDELLDHLVAGTEAHFGPEFTDSGAAEDD